LSQHDIACTSWGIACWGNGGDFVGSGLQVAEHIDTVCVGGGGEVTIGTNQTQGHAREWRAGVAIADNAVNFAHELRASRDGVIVDRRFSASSHDSEEHQKHKRRYERLIFSVHGFLCLS
jgi:hypothetical protein